MKRHFSREDIEMGQQARAKMFNITNQGNANQNRNERSPRIC